jgi:hypothetical protein
MTLNQDTLETILSQLKVKPPSPGAEDRAIRTGIAAFDNSDGNSSVRRHAVAGAFHYLRRWHCRLRPALGTTAAALASVGIITVIGVLQWGPDNVPTADGRQSDTSIEVLSMPVFQPEPPTPAKVALTFHTRPGSESPALDPVLVQSVAHLAILAEVENSAAMSTAKAGGTDSASAGNDASMPDMEDILRVHDSNLRATYGSMTVDKLYGLARTGELQNYLSIPAEKPGTLLMNDPHSETDISIGMASDTDGGFPE